jgi:purine-nucleoside/S-methyl-5'-thioadenosine phosphorylase / adenosine deaminase
MMVIQSELLKRYPGVVFGMSTRNGGVSGEDLGLNLSFNVGDNEANVRENRKRFFESLNIPSESLAAPRQIHSNSIRIADASGTYDGCDGLIGEKKDLFIAISVADCVPVFLFDHETETFAGVHAGWRGSASHIGLNAVSVMQKSFSVNPSNITAFIGPAASACCYDVGSEVAERFQPEFLRSEGNGKFYLDLKAVNRLDLIEAGVRPENIEVHPDCTICKSELYHSFRRDKRKSGRMIGVIGISKRRTTCAG